MKVTSQVKLFPAIGRYVINGYVKYLDNYYKIADIDNDRLILVSLHPYGTVAPKKSECVLHKLYVTHKRIIAEVFYDDYDVINIDKYYEFEIESILTRAKVGDIVEVFKYKLCEFISAKPMQGIVIAINSGDYTIELANGITINVKRHMFKRREDIKYIARLI